MSLQSRFTDFEKFSSRFHCKRPSKLISVYTIDKNLWKKLLIATCIYMSKCLYKDRIILDENELLKEYDLNRSKIKNITPNGMIVPKRHSILEYNFLVKAFADIIDKLNVGDMISSWHVPLNLRIKYGVVDESNMKRHHPTEHIHSDSWAGESSESVTTHLPLFGDVNRNHVVFYDPPQEFEESWLGPLPSYAAGASVAQKYTKINFQPKNGELIMADFATLHSSSRLTGATTRVSIDTTFALKRTASNNGKERIHPWRTEERASPDVLSGLGETHLFLFPDHEEQQVDSKGGFKHPTNLKLTKLLD